MNFFIQDWAGNRLSAHGEFATFEGAWEYVRDKFPEEDWQELFVTEDRGGK